MDQDIALEVRDAQGKRERLPALAAELVRLKVDVLFASTTPAALAATHRIPTIYGIPELSEAGGLMAYRVNLHLGITIPPFILYQATRVIQ